MATEKTLRDEVLEFLAKLPFWQGYLLSQVLEGSTNESATLQQAFKILLMDEGLSDVEHGVTQVNLDGLLVPPPSEQQFKDLKLNAIKEMENVNAIRGKQQLTFGPQLTVIYGDNGSGKSGFVRVLSSVFNSRGDRSILPNVFGPKTKDPPKTTFTFQDETQAAYDLNLEVAKAKPEFSQFAVFDSKSVQVHVNSGNEIYIQPRELAYFEKLASLVTSVANLLEAEITKRAKPNILPQLFEGASGIKSGVEGLNAKTDLEKVKAQGLLSEEEIKRIETVEQELAKIKLQDLEKQKKDLLDFKKTLTGSKQQVISLEKHYQAKPHDYYQKSVQSHYLLQKKVEETGASQFTNAHLKGVGSPSWKKFLESAHAYGHEQGAQYPKEKDQCILCNQSLTSDAAALLQRYWTFLKGEEELQLKKSSETLKQLVSELRSLSHKRIPEGSPVCSWSDQSEVGFSTRLQTYLLQRQQEAEDLISSLEKKEWRNLKPPEAFDVAVFDQLDAHADQQISSLNSETLKKTHDELSRELTTLKHRRKLGEIYNQVEEHVLNLRWLEKAKEYRKKITTKSITDTHKKVHDELLNRKYVQLFHQECAELNAPFKINLEQKGSAGKTKRHLNVEGFQSGQVLSEGEQRAIALADFFTEIEMSGIRAGIIFDDPVNSLDHIRREIIARRLAKAAKTRQVIVFTHDLSFLFDLRNEAANVGAEIKGHWIDKEQGMGNFETGIIHLDCPPTTEKDFINPSEAEKCLKEARDATNPADRIRRVRDGMSNLRTSYEQFITLELFAGTVSRFDRQIHQSKFANAYVPREYVDLVCKKLGYISGFIGGHSHSDHSAGSTPTPDILANEIKEYQEMKGKYRTEKKATLH